MTGMNELHDDPKVSEEDAQSNARNLRWLRRLTVTVVVMSILGVAAAVVPLPYVARLPGPTVNILGAAATKDGTEELLSITGTNPLTGEEIKNPDPSTNADSGQLRMVTVSEMGGPGRRLNVYGWIQAELTPASELVPYSKVYPNNVTREQVDNANKAQMTGSQSTAKVAALMELGWKVPATVKITGTVEGSDAQGKLREGDILQSIETPDGVLHAIETPADPFAIMRKVAPGSTLKVTVKNGEDQRTETVVSAASAGETEGSKLGIYLDAQVNLPVDIHFSLENIGGPSAGMMFSLGIIDRLSEGDMTGGKSIAGTGTMSYDGKVGAIGGIAQKMQGAKRDGASWFLAPENNCDQVIGHVPEGLRVVRVSTLHEAHEAVDAIAADRGDSLPTCEAK